MRKKKVMIYSWEKPNYKPYHWGDQIPIAEKTVKKLKDKRIYKTRNLEEKAEMEALSKYYYNKTKQLTRK